MFHYKSVLPKNQIYMDEQTNVIKSWNEKQCLPLTKDQQDYQMYTKYRNQSKNACSKAVADYEKSLVREVKSNLKAFSDMLKISWISKMQFQS